MSHGAVVQYAVEIGDPSINDFSNCEKFQKNNSIRDPTARKIT
jgi:hypothetical protein